MQQYLGNYRGYVLKSSGETGRVKVWVPQVHTKLYNERLQNPQIFEYDNGSGVVAGLTQAEVDKLSNYVPWASLCQPLIGGGGNSLSYSGRDSTVGDGVPSLGSAVGSIRVSEFALNTDGSAGGSEFSSTHQNVTASGITNGSEILGYTIPLDSSLKKIKEGRLNQPAIITFTSGDKQQKVLAVANDTGGRQIGGDPNNRGWGELGLNTIKSLKESGFGVRYGKNSLTFPEGTVATYEFLDGEVKTVDQYRELKIKLESSGSLENSEISNEPTQKPANVFSGDLSVGRYFPERGIYYGARNNWNAQFGLPPKNKKIISLDFNSDPKDPNAKGHLVAAGPSESDPFISFFNDRLSKLYKNSLGRTGSTTSSNGYVFKKFGNKKFLFCEPFFAQDQQAVDYFFSNEGILEYANIINDFISNNKDEYVVMAPHEGTSGGKRYYGGAVATSSSGVTLNETQWGLKVLSAMLGQEPALCDNFSSVGTKSKEQLTDEDYLNSVKKSDKIDEIVDLNKLLLEEIEKLKLGESGGGSKTQVEVIKSVILDFWNGIRDSVEDVYKPLISNHINNGLPVYSKPPLNSKVNPVSCNVSHTNYSNSAKGSFSIPNVGSEVWVFFEGGDISFPVAFGNSFSDADYNSIFDKSSPAPDYPEDKVGDESNIHRGKWAINERGGSVDIVSTTGRERVKITNYRGSAYEMNQVGATELSIGQKTQLVKGDKFTTVKGDNLESNDYDKEVIVFGDSSEYFGDIKNDYPITERLKELHKPVHEIQQLFDLKRTGKGSSFDSSPLQEKSGTNKACPICIGEGKFPTRVSGKTKFTPAKYNGGSGQKEEIESGGSKVENTKEDTKICITCGGTGVSPWTAEGVFDMESRKREIPDIINTNSAEVGKLENRLSSGGHLSQYIGKTQTVIIGGVMNDLTSIRVDPKGKQVLVGNYASESGKGVFPVYDAIPHVEKVATSNLTGGDFFMQCANRYNLLVGANGIDIKTLGSLNIQGRVMSVAGDQVNISSNNEVSIDGGRSLTMTGDSINFSPRKQDINGKEMKSIALDATVSTTGNTINKGGTLMEGEVFIQHQTAPIEYQESEVTLNSHHLKGGLQIGRVVGDKVFSVATKDAIIAPTKVIYKSPPTTFVETNDDLRRTASILNGADPVMAGPINHMGGNPIPTNYFNPRLFDLLSECNDDEFINRLERLNNGEITEEEFREESTRSSDSPISNSSRSKGCDICD